MNVERKRKYEVKLPEKKIQGILQTKLNLSGALPAIHLYVLSIFKIYFFYAIYQATYLASK